MTTETKVNCYAGFYFPRPGDGPKVGVTRLWLETAEMVSAETCRAEADRVASDCVWIVPATCPDDPLYEASYKRTHELRAHRNAFWLGEYPA